MNSSSAFFALPFRCVRFGDAEMEGDSMRFQLITLARQLGTVNDVLAPQSEVRVHVGLTLRRRGARSADARSRVCMCLLVLYACRRRRSATVWTSSARWCRTSRPSTWPRSHARTSSRSRRCDPLHLITRGNGLGCGLILCVCVCVWVLQIDKEREKQRRNQLEMQKKVQEERIRREVRRAATASTALWKWVTVN